MRQQKSSTMSQDQVIDLLRSKIGFKRTQQHLAKEIGVSQGYMSDVLNKKRGIGPVILEYLDLEVCYRMRKGK